MNLKLHKTVYATLPQGDRLGAIEVPEGGFAMVHMVNGPRLGAFRLERFIGGKVTEHSLSKLTKGWPLRRIVAKNVDLDNEYYVLDSITDDRAHLWSLEYMDQDGLWMVERDFHSPDEVGDYINRYREVGDSNRLILGDCEDGQ